MSGAECHSARKHPACSQRLAQSERNDYFELEDKSQYYPSHMDVFHLQAAGRLHPALNQHNREFGARCYMSIRKIRNATSHLPRDHHSNNTR